MHAWNPVIKMYGCCFALSQTVNKLKKLFLEKCQAHFEIRDVPPYHHILEGLLFLKEAVTPRKYRAGSARRRLAKKLRNILEGTFTCMKDMAKEGLSGMAKLLFMELSGQSGIPALKRILAAMRASKKVQVQVVGGGGGGGDGGGGDGRFGGVEAPRRGYRSRGRPHGDRGRVDLRDVQCHHCRGYGHMRNACPRRDRAGARNNNNNNNNNVL